MWVLAFGVSMALKNYSKDLGSLEDLEVLVQVLSSLWRVYYTKKRAENGCLMI
jgi:hypothetical protein